MILAQLFVGRTRSGLAATRSEAVLDEILRCYRPEIERHLEAVLQPEPGLPGSLLEAMRYSLLAPGKRLRPALVLLATQAAGGPADADPWPAACAVEMVHVYSLIHDDLPAMDDDDLRRGQPTCHRRFGEALAILAGDALLTRAFEVLACSYPAATAAACCRVLSWAAGGAGMVGGQVDDLAWERGEAAGRTPSLPELESLHNRKTGALIRACLHLGAVVAHAGNPPAALVDCFQGYGRCLGLAFQITDDLLDVEGDADQAGKRVGKDASRGKLTYPGLLGVSDSRAHAAHLGREAQRLLVPLGTAARPLLELVSFVLKRDR
jgi:geranylgeranyl diphosphate synthase type II